MSTLKNSDPQLIHDTIAVISDLFSSYGWYIFAIIVCICIVWNKYSIRFYKWRERRELLNTDPQIISSRMEQMEAARRRQQELYDKKIEELKQKELEKQLSKKQELEELQQKGELIKQNELKKRSAGKLLRDNSFNPLMGSSSGSTYRRTRDCGPSGG